MAYNQKTQDKKDIQILKQVEIIISDIRAYLKEGARR